MHLKFRNCNEAFEGLVQDIRLRRITTDKLPSRYGEVQKIVEPVIVTYTEPRERVLFNRARDCNHFFHLFESLWMLAGRNDLAPIVFYLPKMAEFSDDGGVTQPDAYGYRWRQYFGWDQLNNIVDELKNDPTSRRVVLQMWNAWHGKNALNSYVSSDAHSAACGSKGVPCNTQAYFEITKSEIGHPDGAPQLNMTVCNRSNDMIWGMLGANVVHFSMLQEYLANAIGVQVGKYHQFTNNLHVYTKTWTPEVWMDELEDASMHAPQHIEYAFDREDQTVNGGVLASQVPLVKDKETFDKEVKLFVDDFSVVAYGSGKNGLDYTEPFLENVAKPMCLAWRHHKRRDYNMALAAIAGCRAEDWREAGRNWLLKRKANWESKQTDAQAT